MASATVLKITPLNQKPTCILHIGKMIKLFSLGVISTIAMNIGLVLLRKVQYMIQ